MSEPLSTRALAYAGASEPGRTLRGSIAPPSEVAPAGEQLAMATPPASGMELADALSYISTLITIFGAILAVVSVLFILVSFFGFREILQIRELERRLAELMAHSDGARKNYEDARSLVDSLLREVEQKTSDLRDEISRDSDKLIQAAYHFSAGEIAYGRGDFDKAIVEYQRAIVNRPRDINIYNRLGRALVNVDRIVEACNAFEEARRLNENDANCHYGLATVWRYSDHSRAIECAEIAKGLSPTSPEILNYVGLLRRDGGEFDSAIVSHLAALEIQTSSITHFYLALLYGRLNREMEAKAQILSALVALEQELAKDAIRPIWESVIRWAGHVMEDRAEDALRTWKAVVALTTTERVRHAVSDHADFLIGTKQLDVEKFGGVYETEH